jgi:hypothetical protein
MLLISHRLNSIVWAEFGSATSRMGGEAYGVHSCDISARELKSENSVHSWQHQGQPPPQFDVEKNARGDIEGGGGWARTCWGL